MIPEAHNEFFQALHDLCNQYKVSYWDGKITFEDKHPYEVYDLVQVATKENGHAVLYRPAYEYWRYPPNAAGNTKSKGRSKE